jgi:hypothetical protein
MQIMLNIPYVIPQVIVDRILKQVESQLMMKDYLGQRAQRGLWYSPMSRPKSPQNKREKLKNSPIVS